MVDESTYNYVSLFCIACATLLTGISMSGYLTGLFEYEGQLCQIYNSGQSTCYDYDEGTGQKFYIKFGTYAGVFYFILLISCLGFFLRIAQSQNEKKKNSGIYGIKKKLAFNITLVIMILWVCIVEELVCSISLLYENEFNSIYKCPIVLKFVSACLYIIALTTDLVLIIKIGNKYLQDEEQYIILTNFLQTFSLCLLLSLFYFTQAQVIDNYDNGEYFILKFTGYKLYETYNSYLGGSCQGAYFCIMILLNLYFYIPMCLIQGICIIARNMSTLHIGAFKILKFCNLPCLFLLLVLPILTIVGRPSEEFGSYTVSYKPLGFSYLALLILCICWYLDYRQGKLMIQKQKLSGLINSYIQEPLVEMK